LKFFDEFNERSRKITATALVYNSIPITNGINMPFNSSDDTRVLIIGGAGFLGMNWNHFFFSNPKYFFVSSRSGVNMGANFFQVKGYDLVSIKSMIQKLEIHVVINCVGFTDVDGCEENPDLNRELNYIFPKNLNELCASLEVKFVHFSTDHFASKSAIPRSEETFVFPINSYGEMKLLAEKSIVQNPTAVILRTNFFGYNTSNSKKLLDWARLNLLQGKEIQGFDDVFFSPISVSQLIRTTNLLVQSPYTGLFNLAGPESLSKFEFLQKLANVLNIEIELVSRTSIQSSSLKVQRPDYLSLSSTKIARLFPDFKNMTLDAMLVEEVARF